MFGWITHDLAEPLQRYGASSSASRLVIDVVDDNSAFLRMNNTAIYSPEVFLGAIGNGVDVPLWIH